MRKYLVILTLTACFLLHINGFAQGRRTSLFIGASSYFPVEDNIHQGYGSSLGLSILTTRKVTFSVRWDYGRYPVDKEEGKLLNGTIYITPVLASVHYSLINNSSFSPYVFLGAGLVGANFQIGERETPEDQEVREQKIKNGFGLHGGIGIIFRMKGRVSLYAETGFIRSETTVTTTYETLLGTRQEEFSQKLSSYKVTAGIIMYF